MIKEKINAYKDILTLRQVEAGRETREAGNPIYFQLWLGRKDGIGAALNAFEKVVQKYSLDEVRKYGSLMEERLVNNFGANSGVENFWHGFATGAKQSLELLFKTFPELQEENE